MTFIVEALATGNQGAVKLMVLMQAEPTADEKHDLSGRASAQFRVQYGEWCQVVPSVTVTPR